MLRLLYKDIVVNKRYGRPNAPQTDRKSAFVTNLATAGSAVDSVTASSLFNANIISLLFVIASTRVWEVPQILGALGPIASGSGHR